MALYLYYCPACLHSFEVRKPMSEVNGHEACPQCGDRAGRVYTPINFSFGWRLSDKSHERFQPDELVRDI